MGVGALVGKGCHLNPISLIVQIHTCFLITWHPYLLFDNLPPAEKCGGGRWFPACFHTAHGQEDMSFVSGRHGRHVVNMSSG